MKRQIDRDLLHRRLGHIFNNILLFGSKQDSWHEVSAVSNGSTFCAPCKLMMMPKTQRSHTPVTRPFMPGDIGAFDIVPNPFITPLTQDCNYNYLLTLYQTYLLLLLLKTGTITTYSSVWTFAHVDAKYLG